MLNSQSGAAALAVLRQMYQALSEVQESTTNMLEAMDRQDQESLRLFLGMRQEPINDLAHFQELLQRQCKTLPPEEGETLRGILSGKTASLAGAEELCAQVARNQSLLERVIQLDRRVSQKLGGKNSFYRT